jgi:hypothetical protein
VIAKALFSSERQDHNTPDEVLAVVRAFDTIDLDPCSNAQSIVGARVEWRLERGQDGLRKPWVGYGLVFVNWPYEDGLTWARKIANEARVHGAEIIGLGPARTDTEWFQDYIAKYADAMCFWRGRIKFGAGVPDVLQRSLFAANDQPHLKAPESGAPFPSVLPYFGPRPDLFRHVFKDVGWCP